MCLYTSSEPFIAEEDITVYKVIALNNESMIQKFPYVPFHTYKTKLGVAFRQDADVWSNDDVIYRIGTGFHAYIRVSDAERDIPGGWRGSYKIVDFTIPKGAKVYRSFTYIVSDTIRSGSLEPLVQ